MKKSSIIWLIIIVIVVVLGVWYWSSMGQQSSSSTNTNVTNQPVVSSTPSAVTPLAKTTPTTTVLLYMPSKTGAHLVALNGMTLYKYAKDQLGISNCTGQCSVIWPPYTIPASEASSSLGGGMAVLGQVGTITRADGTLQVTYNNIPLYFYSKDKKTGDTTGQGVGGVWSVVSP